MNQEYISRPAHKVEAQCTRNISGGRFTAGVILNRFLLTGSRILKDYGLKICPHFRTGCLIRKHTGGWHFIASRGSYPHFGLSLSQYHWISVYYPGNTTFWFTATGNITTFWFTTTRMLVELGLQGRGKNGNVSGCMACVVAVVVFCLNVWYCYILHAGMPING